MSPSKRFGLTLLGLCTLIETSQSAETVLPIKSFMGEPYAELRDRTLKLDLYRPEDTSQPRPAVVCIHGGAWRAGTRASCANVAKALASRGYVTATISYRLSGEAQFPAQIEDCKAGVRWLRAHASEYGIDADRIGAIGHSAGGHLAALLATSGEVASLEGHGGNALASSQVQAAVAMGAQSNLVTERIRRISQTKAADFYLQFLGGTMDEESEVYRLASPFAHLDAGDPPLAFVTGELDDPSTRAADTRRRLVELGIPTDLLVIAGAPHNFLTNRIWFEESIDFADGFFQKHLRPESP